MYRTSYLGSDTSVLENSVQVTSILCLHWTLYIVSIGKEELNLLWKLNVFVVQAPDVKIFHFNL